MNLSSSQFQSQSPNYQRSLNLVLIESAITASSICTPIMTPFFHSIGLSQTEISITQALFTVVVMLVDFPAGWLADRFGRKWANIVGDLGAALSYFLYASVSSFAGVVCSECLLGFFTAFSEGVDFSLLKHFSHQISPSEDYFRQQSARLAFWQHVVSLSLTLLGGPIGAISFRLAIIGSGLTRLIGGLISLWIVDDSEKLQGAKINPFCDMSRISLSIFKNHPLRNHIFAYAVGREMSHAIIWVFTPMLLVAGVPLQIASMGWVLNSLACIIGARLATRFSRVLSSRQVFAFPLALMVLSMTILSFQIDPWTIGFYALMGVAQGWVGATMLSRVQQLTLPSEQTSVVSFAKVVAKALYVPAICLTGVAADLRLNFAPLVTLTIFLPLGLLSLRALKE